MKNSNNIVLAGVPRSGTTLTCYLLNKLPNTVALNETLNAEDLPQFKSPQDVSDYVDLLFEQQRNSIVERRIAISHQVKGDIPVNNFTAERDPETGLRIKQVSKGEISIEKNLQPDFILVIKSLIPFTLILENLIERFPTYAVLRNPLAVIASWSSVPFFSMQEGKIPEFTRLDSELDKKMSELEDKVDRMFYLLSWFYDKYRRLLPKNSILRYEDIVASGGKALKVIQPLSEQLNETLENQNVNKVYDRESTRFFGERLLKYEGAFWNFYTRESVELLLKQLLESNQES